MWGYLLSTRSEFHSRKRPLNSFTHAIVPFSLFESFHECSRKKNTSLACHYQSLTACSQAASLVATQSVGTSAVTLLSNGKLDTLALGQGDPGLLGANDEDVGLPCSEGVVNGVLDVDDVETTIVTLTVGNNTDTTHVTTTSNHGDVANLELDKVIDLASGEAVEALSMKSPEFVIYSHR